MAVFPFGEAAGPRPPRRPAADVAKVFVLGVYPSALHVRWTLPSARPEGLPAVVGALAVADEPTVFWDGADADRLVAEWAERRGFRTGDGLGDHGRVTAAGNGTSGRPVRDKALQRLGVDVRDVWFTDAVDSFFVKKGTAGRNQQGDVIERVYNRFADSRNGLERADLPERPSVDQLVELAVTEHRARLRMELVEADAPILITLGEEARRVLAGIADEAAGPPLTPLTRGPAVAAAYGRPGSVTIDNRTIGRWYALAHPGNRDTYWAGLHASWTPEPAGRRER